MVRFKFSDGVVVWLPLRAAFEFMASLRREGWKMDIER